MSTIAFAKLGSGRPVARHSAPTAMAIMSGLRTSPAAVLRTAAMGRVRDRGAVEDRTDPGPRLLEMPRDDLGEVRLVPSLQGFDHLHVLLHRAAPAVRRLVADEPDALEPGLDRLVRRDEEVVARQGHDRRVDCLVELVVLEAFPALIELHHPVVHLPDVRDLRVGGIPAGQAPAEGLEGDQHLEHVAHVPGRERAHDRAAPRTRSISPSLARNFSDSRSGVRDTPSACPSWPSWMRDPGASWPSMIMSRMRPTSSSCSECRTIGAMAGSVMAAIWPSRRPGASRVHQI